MQETLVLTLIGPDGHRHEPPREVVAAAAQPLTLVPAIEEMLRAAATAPQQHTVEVEVAELDGSVRYLLVHDAGGR